MKTILVLALILIPPLVEVKASEALAKTCADFSCAYDEFHKGVAPKTDSLKGWWSATCFDTEPSVAPVKFAFVATDGKEFNLDPHQGWSFTSEPTLGPQFPVKFFAVAVDNKSPVASQIRQVVTSRWNDTTEIYSPPNVGFWRCNGSNPDCLPENLQINDGTEYNNYTVVSYNSRFLINVLSNNLIAYYYCTLDGKIPQN